MTTASSGVKAKDACLRADAGFTNHQQTGREQLHVSGCPCDTRLNFQWVEG